MWNQEQVELEEEMEQTVQNLQEEATHHLHQYQYLIEKQVEVVDIMEGEEVEVVVVEARPHHQSQDLQSLQVTKEELRMVEQEVQLLVQTVVTAL